MTVDQVKALAETLAKVFVSAAIAQWLVTGGQLFDVGSDGYKSVLTAGAAAAGVALFNFLNPNDTRYGRGSASSD